jgi:hypothetical protein
MLYMVGHKTISGETWKYYSCLNFALESVQASIVSLDSKDIIFAEDKTNNSFRYQIMNNGVSFEQYDVTPIINEHLSKWISSMVES